MTIGAWWGLGHGTTATLLGLAAFYLKGQIGGNLIFRETFIIRKWAVGASLLLIGGIGVRDSLSADEVNAVMEMGGRTENFDVEIIKSDICERLITWLLS